MAQELSLRVLGEMVMEAEALAAQAVSPEPRE
jgi:hypothetical protein